MSGKEVVKKDPIIIKEYQDRIDKLKLKKSRNFVSALWSGFEKYSNVLAEYRWRGRYYFDTLHESFKELCGCSASKCETLEEFFNPKLIAALEGFFGVEETQGLKTECAMAMEFPYSHNIYRPSYRSKHAGDYADVFFMAMVNAIEFLCYGFDVAQALKTASLPGLDKRVAMAIRSGDEKVFALIEEAILGDNSEILINHLIISAIVKSGNSQALELLGKLLLAAKGQEGLRQAILETCDSGTIESHRYFIKLILENDLCRFSSVVRAFDTWSGLGFGDQKQRVAEKCMSLAARYLEDSNAGLEGLDSKDTTEIYLALWAICCNDVYSATEHARKLLNSSEKYKRLVGWYFITHTSSSKYAHDVAVSQLDVRDFEELAWICDNLNYNGSLYCSTYSWDEEQEQTAMSKSYPNDIYPTNKKERINLFKKVAEVVEFIGKKNPTFEGSVFPWCTKELSADKPCHVLFSLAAYDRNPDLINSLVAFLPQMSSDLRLKIYSFLLDPNIKAQRAFLLEGLSDKSSNVRGRVISRLKYYSLSESDMVRLSETLTSQNSDLRKGIIALFQKEQENLVRPVIDGLLASSNKNQLISGVELLDIFLKKNPELQTEYQENISKLASAKNISQDVSILFKKIISGESIENEYTAENGYGLYNPEEEIFDKNIFMSRRPSVPVINDAELKELIVPKEEDIFALYDRIVDIFKEYRNYEYETEHYNGTREKILLNDNSYRISPLAGMKDTYDITAYPLAEKWLAAAGNYAEDKKRLLPILSIWCESSYYYKKIDKTWYHDLFSGYPVGSDNELSKKVVSHAEGKEAYAISKVNQILNLILDTGKSDLFDFAFAVYVNLVRKIPEERLLSTEGTQVLSESYLSFWRNLAYQYINTDEQFITYFNEMWAEYLLAGQQNFYGIDDQNIIYRAHSLGIIPDDAVYLYFTTGANAPRHMNIASNTGNREIFEKYPVIEQILAKAIDRVVTIEENRGELPTVFTRVASKINRFNGGSKHFVALLAALGDIGFARGYSYYYYNNNDLTKKDSLSRLLKCCYPCEEDRPEILKKALEEAKITEKRVIQAALYAPQWAGLLERAMGIPGLKCGVWFFHAHVNEGFTAEKETEVAIFSAISPQQFNDGTFDRSWFFETYNALGEKRFSELYKNAKYITDSNSAHRRSQLYADAVLGRLLKDETKEEITSKRNQEKLRAFALIPLDKKNKNDALERYEFIHKFKKESRQFGSQRQASERKACDIALDNLAITTGYSDADRMTWMLEGSKIEQLRPLMKPYTIDETEVWLSISDEGVPELNVRKKGKMLKSLPKSLANHEKVSDIKEAVKQLRDQKSRAHKSFEMSMISRSVLKASEIVGLLKHPILSGMISSLVFVSGDNLGFPSLEGNKLVLVGPDGQNHKIASNASVIIAHPYDLMSRKCWSEYQQYLYQNKITQPFKQVFREYYPITQDEQDSVNVSRRYEGNQVQPKKTVALLKTRGWTVDYEEGLQRVWHKDNLVVRLYAMADWFSPSDIESPTLETIQFFKRDKWEKVAFSDISPVIFSETMRDIDLVVSVAHVGGVDPEASHSTVEMRTAIARELLAMLSVKNVSFQSAHAQIKGNLGEYSIHMGSGVVHKSGVGMIAVLPVHSQARGRIFLPFADDDPKTAEVLSKILLFADDKKIKDPSILDQIKS